MAQKNNSNTTFSNGITHGSLFKGRWWLLENMGVLYSLAVAPFHPLYSCMGLQLHLYMPLISYRGIQRLLCWRITVYIWHRWNPYGSKQMPCSSILGCTHLCHVHGLYPEEKVQKKLWDTVIPSIVPVWDLTYTAATITQEVMCKSTSS